jgi:hypothetical protein
LLGRIEILEALAVASTPQFLRFGWLATQLPEDYEGERHYIPVNCRPTGSPLIEWCEFEEKAGPAPSKNRFEH